MWGHALGGQRRSALGGSGCVLVEQARECVMGERLAGACRKERIGGFAGTLVEPSAQDGDRRRGQRRDPLLASLAVAADVGAAPEVDVAAPEPGQLGGAQPRLDGE